MSNIAAELATSLPQYDPLAPARERSGRWILLVSALIHLILLIVFWDMLIGVVIEKEETVTVRMVEEQPKLQRKVLAQRRIDTSVRQFRDVAQPEIQRVSPVRVLDQVEKIEVAPTQITEAPKKIVDRRVVTKTVSAFADTVAPVQPIQVDKVSPTVKQVKAARASAGPRKLKAAGPIVAPKAAAIAAPTVTKGQISQNAVDGDLEGARIADLTSGTSEGMIKGTGKHGLVSSNKDCMNDPVCQAYLKLIRDRVYARWNVGNETAPGKVKLRFRIDRGGSAHNVKMAFADDSVLGESCLLAFRQASPFPPPPKEIHYLVNKGIVATFDYGR